MINRLVEPSAGRVLIDGATSRRDARRTSCGARIGYAIQGHGLFPHRTVAREHRHRAAPARLGPGAHRGAGRGAARRCSSSIRRTSRPAIRTSSPAGSSSASASPARWRPSPLLLMDEPFGALDPIIRGKAQDDLLAIQRRFGTTIVLVTHDMDEAFHLGDRIAVMERRPPRCNMARPAELLAHPATDFVGALTGRGRARLPAAVAARPSARPSSPARPPGAPIPADAIAARRAAETGLARRRGAAGRSMPTARRSAASPSRRSSSAGGARMSARRSILRLRRARACWSPSWAPQTLRAACSRR